MTPLAELRALYPALEAEYLTAVRKHPERPHSPHEAYGFVAEGFDEFKEAVFHDTCSLDRDTEALHIMVTAARSIIAGRKGESEV